MCPAELQHCGDPRGPGGVTPTSHPAKATSALAGLQSDLTPPAPPPHSRNGVKRDSFGSVHRSSAFREEWGAEKWLPGVLRRAESASAALWGGFHSGSRYKIKQKGVRSWRQQPRVCGSGGAPRWVGPRLCNAGPEDASSPCCRCPWRGRRGGAGRAGDGGGAGAQRGTRNGAGRRRGRRPGIGAA